jgi:hypothetical protein
MGVLILSTTFVWFISLSKGNEQTSSCQVKVPVFLAMCYWSWNFLDRFSKNTPISTFMKTRTVGAELLLADWQTGRHGEANSLFFQIMITRLKIYKSFKRLSWRIDKKNLRFYSETLPGLFLSFSATHKVPETLTQRTRLNLRHRTLSLKYLRNVPHLQFISNNRLWPNVKRFMQNTPDVFRPSSVPQPRTSNTELLVTLYHRIISLV